ncbi:hypothetical protein OROMI_010666 [Orobanche minor]
MFSQIYKPSSLLNSMLSGYIGKTQHWRDQYCCTSGYIGQLIGILEELMNGESRTLCKSEKHSSVVHFHIQLLSLLHEESESRTVAYVVESIAEPLSDVTAAVEKLNASLTMKERLQGSYFFGQDEIAYHWDIDKLPLGEVSNMVSKKAEGPDGILVEVWRCLGERGIKWVTMLFNKIWRSNKMPSAWRKSILVPLYKNKEKKLIKSNMVSPLAAHQPQLAMLAQLQSLLMAAAAAAAKIPANVQQPTWT